MPEQTARRRCVCTRIRYNPRLYGYRTYTSTRPPVHLCARVHVRAHVCVYMLCIVCECGRGRDTRGTRCRTRQRNGRGGRLNGGERVDQRWRLTTSRALSIYLIPRSVSLSSLSFTRACLYSSPAEPLFLYPTAFRFRAAVSRRDILLEFCHVRVCKGGNTADEGVEKGRQDWPIRAKCIWSESIKRNARLSYTRLAHA